MKGFLLDTNESLEFELRLINEYEKNSKKLKEFESGSLKKNDPDHSKVELLHNCLPKILKKKEEKLKSDKLLNHLKKIDSTNGIRHKTNMKKY